MNLIKAMHYIYLSKNGAAFQTFTDWLFDRMDRRPNHWADRFVMTDTFQNIFGSLPGVDAERTSVRMLSQPVSDNTTSTFKALTRIQIDYAISQPLQNITREASPVSCQQPFTLLLQIYRVKYLLRGLVSSSQHRLRTVPPDLGQAILLRHRLTWFIEVIHQHVSDMAARTFRELESSLTSAHDVDAMVTASALFREHIASRLLLSEKMRFVHDTLLSILQLSEDLARVCPSMTKDAGVGRSTGAVSEGDGHSSSLIPSSPLSKSTGTTHEDTEETNDGSVGGAAHQEEPQKASGLLKHFDRELALLVAALRGMGRAGGDTAYSNLSEALDWRSKVANDS